MIKEIVRQFAPTPAYERSRRGWHSCQKYLWYTKLAIRWRWPDLLLHFGEGPGDDLLCTTVLRELKKRGRKKIWMMSKNPELFDKNTDVDRVVPMDDRFREYVNTIHKSWLLLEYARVDAEMTRSEPPKRHILAEICGRAGVRGEIAVRPHLHLTEEERTTGAWAKGAVAIQSSGLGGRFPMQNKQWFPERFQEVVGKFKGSYKFVQLGSASDPLLENVVDMRGKTPIRETASVLANCRLFVGNVGFMMHLARAVECPSVIVFGGREAPWQSGYNCNVNLYSPVPCAPCWLWNKCDFNRTCMDRITAENVIDAMKALLARPRENLAVDILQVSE